LTWFAVADDGVEYGEELAHAGDAGHAAQQILIGAPGGRAADLPVDIVFELASSAWSTARMRSEPRLRRA